MLPPNPGLRIGPGSQRADQAARECTEHGRDIVVYGGRSRAHRGGGVYVGRIDDHGPGRGAGGCGLAFGRRRTTSAGKTCSAEPASMTELQFFAFIILPVAVVALGWGAVVLNERFGSLHRPAGK